MTYQVLHEKCPEWYSSFPSPGGEEVETAYDNEAADNDE